MSCGKKKLDKTKAMMIVANAKRQDANHNRNEKRWYFCRDCKAYYTTSKPKY